MLVLAPSPDLTHSHIGVLACALFRARWSADFDLCRNSSDCDSPTRLLACCLLASCSCLADG
eukprot:scaffold27403_cov110-Isochrysis_galbana.AAC.4